MPVRLRKSEAMQTPKTLSRRKLGRLQKYQPIHPGAHWNREGRHMRAKKRCPLSSLA